MPLGLIYVLFFNVMTFRQKCEDTPGVCEYLYREFETMKLENDQEEHCRLDLILTEAKLSAGLVEPLSVAGCSCSVSEFKHKLFMRNIQTRHLLSGTVHLNKWQQSL